MEDRLILAAFTAAHQLGASVWIGAMPFLLISLKRVADADEGKRLLRRFSPMALVGAGTLLAGGVGMAWFYLGISADHSLSGLYGTAYGVMMLSKVYLVVMVMALGAGNFFLVRRIETAPLDLLARLRRFGEVEIGLGFMAVLAAASMTSQPPAVDMPNDRVSIAEIVARFHPIVPRMTSPAFGQLVASTPLDVAVKETQFSGANAPSDANDEAWSEYNHHWSGVIVLAAGFFALAEPAAVEIWVELRMGAELAHRVCGVGGVSSCCAPTRIAGLWGRGRSGRACMPPTSCSIVCMRC